MLYEKSSWHELHLLPLTGLDQVKLILDDVVDLIKSGILNDGQGGVLTVFLEESIKN